MLFGNTLEIAMGIRSPESFSYKSCHLQWKHIVYLVFEFVTEHYDKGSQSEQSKRPVIDIDANILGFKYVIVMARDCPGEVIRYTKVGVDEGIEMNVIIEEVIKTICASLKDKKAT